MYTFKVDVLTVLPDNQVERYQVQLDERGYNSLLESARICPGITVRHGEGITYVTFTPECEVKNAPAIHPIVWMEAPF